MKRIEIKINFRLGIGKDGPKQNKQKYISGMLFITCALKS